jgi:geranylgeranyl pyrophosphate synthase
MGDSPAAARLADLLAGEPPSTDAEVELATRLIGEAGGLDWAAREADARLAAALRHLDALPLVGVAAAELAEVATYIVTRDR